MASGAGVNRVGTLGGIPLLTVLPGASTPAGVLLGAYGTNSGPPTDPSLATVGNDSGVQMLAAVGFTKWTFSIIGPGAFAATTAAFTIAIYGTIDPVLLRYAYQNAGNKVNSPGHDPSLATSLTAIPASSWFLLPGSADQAGTGTITNPIVTSATTTPVLNVSMPLVAVRAVLYGAAPPTTGTAGVTVLGFAVP